MKNVLSFSKAMSLNCSGFVYYSWKSLFIQNVYWDVLRGLVFFKNKFTYGMKSLSQHFDKEIYRYVHITWLLLTGKYLCWSLFLILSIVKFLRASTLKNICERLLLKMCSWNWENLFIMSFNFTLRNRFFQHQYQKQVHSGISWLVSHEVCIHTQHFFGVVRNKLQTKGDQKFMKRICHMNVLWILTNEKHFPKTINQWEVDYGSFTNLLRIIVNCDFSPSSFKLKRGILPLLRKHAS